jgi:hypothetical protein
MQKAAMKNKIGALTTKYGVRMEKKSKNRVHGRFRLVSKASQIFKLPRVPGQRVPIHIRVSRDSAGVVQRSSSGSNRPLQYQPEDIKSYLTQHPKLAGLFTSDCMKQCLEQLALLNIKCGIIKSEHKVWSLNPSDLP